METTIELTIAQARRILLLELAAERDPATIKQVWQLLIGSAETTTEHTPQWLRVELNDLRPLLPLLISHLV